MSVRHEFACRSLILYHKEPPPTHRSIPESIHIALTTYSPRITTGCSALCRWRCAGGQHSPETSPAVVRHGTQWWTVVVDVPTTPKPSCGLFFDSRFTILCSLPRGGGWGFGMCVDRCMINHNIYDCDVFRSFFHLYNPYEPSESEKKTHRNKPAQLGRGHR